VLLAKGLFIDTIKEPLTAQKGRYLRWLGESVDDRLELSRSRFAGAADLIHLLARNIHVSAQRNNKKINFYKRKLTIVTMRKSTVIVALGRACIV
jgi:hypothetical protein